MGKSATDYTVTARTPSGIDIATGAAVVVATTLAATAFPGVTGRLAVMAVAVAGYTAVVTDTRAGTAVAAMAYLLFNGFLLNRYGDLTGDGTTSIWDIAVFVLAVASGPTQKWIRYVRMRTAVDAELDKPVNTPTSKR